jgi:hypothetical protein
MFKSTIFIKILLLQVGFGSEVSQNLLELHLQINLIIYFNSIYFLNIKSNSYKQTFDPADDTSHEKPSASKHSPSIFEQA